MGTEIAPFLPSPRRPVSMSRPSVRTLLSAAIAEHRRSRRIEAVLRGVGGTLPAVAVGVLVAAGQPMLGWAVAVGGAAVAWGLAWHAYRAARITPDDLARAIDRSARHADLVHTAYCIETGRSSGAPALGAHVVRQALDTLPPLLVDARRPFRLPRRLPAGIVVAAAVWMWPRTVPTGPAVVSAPVRPLGSDETAAIAPAPSVPDAPAPAGASASEQTSTQSGGAAGTDRPSSGGAEVASDAGTEGGKGGAGASGSAEATAASGESPGDGATSGGEARDAGTSGVTGAPPSEGEGSEAGGPSRAGAPTTPEDADAAPAGPGTTGMVDGVGAETDAVRSDAETMSVSGATPDDTDAQTRDVAGTLDLQTSGPQFFDATETADAEQDGKGGAGGWTIGLSQPGEGGVNDASGSTWRTEAGVADPPDWTDAPADWVDAAWQDSPAGVIRRVRDGQAGGSGSADYTAAWQRYAAVAEAASAPDTVPPGRRALVRQYFLAIAPSESP